MASIIVEVGFATPVVRQNVVKAPTRRAAGDPVVEIPRQAANGHHAVDAGAAAHETGLFVPARHEVLRLIAAQTFVVDAQVTPMPCRVEIGDAGIGIQHGRRHLVRRGVGACFQQQYALCRVGRQTIGEHGAGRTATDNNVVVDQRVTETKIRRAGDRCLRRPGSRRSSNRLRPRSSVEWQHDHSLAALHRCGSGSGRQGRFRP